jgi:outer membrane protein W
MRNPMNNRLIRIFFALFLVAGASRTFAQAPASNEAGIWITGSKLNDPTIDDVDLGAIGVDFDESLGFGLSFNHYWTDRFSTELSYHATSADITLSVPVFPTEPDPTGGPIFIGTVDIDAGTIDIRSLSAVAQLHFRRGTRFAPYIGAGVTRLSGEIDPTDDPDFPEEGGTVDLESKITWVANLGADLALTDHIALALDARYMPWDAMENNDPDQVKLDLSPLMVSAGLKVRF